MCTAANDSWNLAAVNDKHLKRCIASLLWLTPLFTMATVAKLSDCTSNDWPNQFLSHTAAAITIGANSLTEMWECSR